MPAYLPLHFFEFFWRALFSVIQNHFSGKCVRICLKFLCWLIFSKRWFIWLNCCSLILFQISNSFVELQSCLWCHWKFSYWYNFFLFNVILWLFRFVIINSWNPHLIALELWKKCWIIDKTFMKLDVRLNYSIFEFFSKSNSLFCYSIDFAIFCLFTFFFLLLEC